MKTLVVLKKVIKATGVLRVIAGFVIFFLVSALIILLLEPQIENYGDACWYCFAVISTCGFGDIVVYSPAARVVSALLSIYAVVCIALLTGVVVNLHTKLIESRMRGTLAEVLDKVQHLSELSKEELDEISEEIRRLL